MEALNGEQEALRGGDARAGAGSDDSCPEGLNASERFARCAEEVARTAEIGQRTFMEHVAELLASGEHRAPDSHSDSRREEQPLVLMPEARDAIPFGLKRRVRVGFPIRGDETCRTPAACGVCLRQPPALEVEDCIDVDDEDIFLEEPLGRVPQGRGDTEERIFPEESQLRQIRRAVAQVAIDLITEMMEIDARFAQALAAQGRPPAAPYLEEEGPFTSVRGET